MQKELIFLEGKSVSCADHNTTSPLKNDEEIAEFNSQSCKIEKASKLYFLFSMPAFED